MGSLRGRRPSTGRVARPWGRPMADESIAGLEERILLLGPTKKDAAAAGRLFGSAGMTLTPCDDLAEVCAEMERGAAVAIVPDEAILKDRDGCLGRFLSEQP